MSKVTKNNKAINESFDKKQEFEYKAAISKAKELSFEKFDASFEVAFNLNLDTTQADQQLRGSIVLPNGTGRTAKVLVIGSQDDQDKAKKAGADHIGGIEMMEKVSKENWFDFDFIVTTPDMMPKLARYGKILGPKGLMPNPKLGTVTSDISTAVDNIKKGQLEYRTDKEGIVALSFGKKSFDDKKLIENYETIFNLIKSLRPATVKGDYFISITISTTMGPGIKVLTK